MARRGLVPVLLLLFAMCDAGEDGADAEGDAGDGTEDQSSISMPGDDDSCKCVDSDTWVAPNGMGPCASYAVGEVNEGYCHDDGATAHCPKACDACPACAEPVHKVNGWMVLMGIICMSVCFGVPTAKYFVDLARFSAKQYRQWKAAQDEKMHALHTKNTVRKAKNRFLAMGAAGKLKGLSFKVRKAKVAPGPADMRTEQEEAELAQLSEQITRDQETLQRFSDEGNGDSTPFYTLRSQVDSAVARQTELQSKRPYNRELVQRMEQVKRQREAAEAAKAASAAQEAMAQAAAGQGLDLETPSSEPEPEPEPQPQPLASPVQVGGMLPPLQGSPAALPQIRPPPGGGGGASGMRIGGLRGDGHSHVFDRNPEAHTEAKVVHMGADARLEAEEDLVFKIIRDAMHAHRKMYGHTIDSTGAIFAAMDRHGQGTLSFDEFTEALGRLDIGLAPQDITLIFKNLLPDGSSAENGGVVHYEEFAQALHSHATRAHANLYQQN
jgi:Ca2+-binding EF-hand superfamily protein